MSIAIGAAFVAVVWTLGMIAWSWPVDLPGAVIWAVGGAIVGLLWYLAMDWWMRRKARGGDGPA